MSYVFAYDVDMELDGIWIGMLIGGGSNCLLQFGKIMLTDVGLMAIEISKRIDENDMQHSIVKSFKLAQDY